MGEAPSPRCMPFKPCNSILARALRCLCGMVSKGLGSCSAIYVAAVIGMRVTVFRDR